MKTLNTFFIFLFTLPAFANNTVNIGESKGFFAPVTRFLQEAVDFFAGPFGLAAVAIISIMAIIAWMAASRMENLIGNLVRALIGAVFILNISLFLASLTLSS